MTARCTASLRVIVPLSQNDASCIADVLTEAFRADPAFLHLFDSTAEGNDEYFRRFTKLWAAHALAAGNPLFGVRQDGVLAGVVGVDGLLGGPRTWSWRGDVLPLLGVLPGMNIWRGLRLAMAIQAPSTIPAPSCEISMLGIIPRFQGQGLAASLLAHAHDLIATIAPEKNIYLYTTLAGAYQFYRKQGYDLLRHRRSETVDVFHLLRPRTQP